ncbi:MAG: hypothetical protein JWR27_1192 [Aeromicrobium sp.]|nr:hypothetical protein [Aeromicrobium sp.]
MRFRRTVNLIALLVAAILPLLTSVEASSRPDVSNAGWYANQTPYGNAASAQTLTPPTGYDLVFLETVGRHGSRTMTNDDAEVRALEIWRSARSAGGLTTRGERFDDDLAAFQRVERRLGYGNLSTTGKDEWRGIGRRTADSYASFFARVVRSGDQVAMTTSPVNRTKESASAMTAGLLGEVAGLTFTAPRVDQELVIGNGSTQAGKAAIAEVLRRSSVRDAARRVLQRLYRPAYVSRIGDPVAAALDLYALYAQAAGMRSDTAVTFAAYVPVSDAKVLASAKDAQSFYRYGPGVKGERDSFEQAAPILDDFFARLDERLDGGRTAAVFRHAHGETTMPFAALTRMPGSQEQAAETAPYSHANNPWRGYLSGRLGGNIEWSAFGNKGGSVLVTVRHNERPVRLSSACTPSSVGGGWFYRVTELKKCLG